MNKVKILVFSLGITVLSCSTSFKKDEVVADNSWTIIVSGKVGYPQAGNITIAEVKNGAFGWQDTIMLNSHYAFKKKVKLSQPGYYKINFYNRQIVDVILYKNDIEVNVDGNNASGFLEVKGSSELDLIYQVQGINAELERSAEVSKLNEAFVAAQNEKDQAQMLALQQEYMKLSKLNSDKVANLISKQPVSLGVIHLLQSNALDKDEYFSVYLNVAEKLKKEWPNYESSKDFVEMVDRMKAVSIGQLAPEIALPDPSGKVVKLSSFKGKYVLVDFWAKWCGPCRQENPNVVRAYTKYKDKGFTVLGVSLDRNREDWLKAIEEDKLTWTHISDLKYWQSEAAKTYNITGIPFSLLLDPTGKIIAKNLRGPALEKKLAEVLGGK